MDSLETLTTVLGWCTVLNTGMLVFAGVALMAAGGPIKRMHGQMYGLSDDDLSRAYFQYLAIYKVAIFVFNFVPYVALRIAT
jgi:hypothetical protein